MTPYTFPHDALTFLQAHWTGVVSTISPQHTPHAAVVYYTALDDGTLYFATFTDTRKYQHIQRNPTVAFTVAAVEVPRTLQIEGV